MTQEAFEYLLLALMILGPVVLLVRQHFINKAPTYTASATVVSRRVSPAKVNGKYSACWNYLVSFQLRDGECIGVVLR